jgi:LuxR family quorum-sensing transcriptional regulator LasR
MISQALEPFLDLLCITTSNDLMDCLKERVLQLGFSRFQLCLSPSKNAHVRNELVIGDYPQAWRDAYEHAGYAKIDPVLLHCMQNVTPIVWTEQLYSSPQRHSLRALALTHGLEYGVTFALHGPQGQFGTLNLNLQASDIDQAQSLIRRQMGTLLMLRDAALQAALTLVMPVVPVVPPTLIKLTRREKEVLRWSAFGKTSWEISNICSCSEANVDFHFKNIRRKFSVTTRSAAVVQALSMQLIQI